MNIGGDLSISKNPNVGRGQTRALDAASFAKALDTAAKNAQTIVPMASEAGQLALAKKKEKKTINRVQEAKEAADDTAHETVDQVVKNIAAQIRFLAELERKNLGL